MYLTRWWSVGYQRITRCLGWMIRCVQTLMWKNLAKIVCVRYIESYSNRTATTTIFLGPRSMFYAVTWRSSPKNNQSWKNRKILNQYNHKKEIQVCRNAGSNLHKSITTRLIGWYKKPHCTSLHPLIPSKKQVYGDNRILLFLCSVLVHPSRSRLSCMIYFRYFNPSIMSIAERVTSCENLWSADSTSWCTHLGHVSAAWFTLDISIPA